MRDTSTLDPRGQRRGRADCGVRSRNQSREQASGIDPTDRADRAEPSAA